MSQEKKLKEIVIKLAGIVKSQNAKIKKLAQQVQSEQQKVFSKVMQASNSYLIPALSDQYGGEIKVRLESQGDLYNVVVTVNVKGQVDSNKAAGIKAGLSGKLSSPEFVKDVFPSKVTLDAVNFVTV